MHPLNVSLIPETAPFNAEQRAWLNGFLAGWSGLLDAPGAEGGAEQAILAPPDASSAPTDAAEEEDFPWHDPALEMDERLKLADGKPFNRRLMAAMAQLDCGACGYVCKTYSEAIAAGDEKNLTLCSPGGKETAKMLKRLVKEGGGDSRNGAATNGAPINGSAANGAAVNGAASNGAARAADTPAGFSRKNPLHARVKSCHNLNAPGSAKHTTHVVIDLGDSGLDYKVGDSLGVYPTNCPELVDDVLAALGAEADAAARERLIERYCLKSASDELLELLAETAGDDNERSAVAALVDSDELDELDVLDVLRLAPRAKVPLDAFLSRLNEIAPRLYSIASSHRAHPGEVHLTVGLATTSMRSRLYKGVASSMFAHRLGEGDTVRVYVHGAHGFTVPADPAAPMIMVGPGTGVAPFRAFLEERRASGATGKNWLFFGDQREATDFLYRDELESLAADGVLNRLSSAFSRDQDEKVYVQNRMRDEGAELFEWLDAGAYFFVCGDAKRMAVDVDRALHEIVAAHGALGADDAAAYVNRLKSEGRYVRDVY